MRRGVDLKDVAAGVVLVLVAIGAGLFISPLFGSDGDGAGSSPFADVVPGAKGGGKDPSAPPVKRRKLRSYESVVARARGRRVRVYARHGSRKAKVTLRARRIEGQKVPLVLLVRKRQGRRLQVYLPTRPNLSKGWVRRRDVTLRATPYRLEVQLRKHRLIVWRGRKVVARKPIGTGRSVSPTPTGRYFITDLIRARDPKGLYGPYAFGLSGHSTVYTSFRGGTGQLGLHGTNAPQALGTDVSAGCIRLGNRAIAALARQLPLGTPVTIER